MGREETEIVGDEPDPIGDEADGGEILVDLLLATAYTFAPTSLSPRDQVSEWNQFGGQYAPLLWPRREVYLEVALYAPGTDTGGTSTIRAEVLGTGDGSTTVFYTARKPLVLAPNIPVAIYLDGVVQQSGYTVDYDAGSITFDAAPAAGVAVTADYTYWRALFHGLIDRWKTQGSTITLDCRDRAARLMDTYLLDAAEYGSEEGVPLETVMQQILDDHLGAGAVTLYCPVSPGFMVRTYPIEYVTVWQALQDLAAKTVGWYLGYRWREATGQFELTLMEPPRSKDAATADYQLTATDDIYVNDLGGAIDDVRNLVKVAYRDSATGERASVTVEDVASQQEYGKIGMGIEEDDASAIDTQPEATAFANAALADLKDQHATTRLELPLLPWLDLMDGVTIDDPRTSSTVDFYAVESVEHRLDWSDPERAILRTQAVCSGKVAGAHTRWLDMQTRPGARGEPTRPPTTQTRPSVPEALSLAPILRGFAAACKPATDPLFQEYELHVSTTAGFNPTGWDGFSWIGRPNDPAAWDGTTNTLAAVGRTLPVIWQGGEPGTTYYAVMVARNLSGVRSGPSPEVSAVAGKTGSGDYGGGTVGTIHIVQDAITGLEIIEVSDATGTSTTSATFVDVPGFSVSFTLQDAATVLIYCTMDAYAYSTASGVYVVGVGAQLVIDGSAASGSIRRALYNEVDSGGAPQQYMYLRGALPVVTSRQLLAGSHTIKAQFRREGSDAETAAVVYDRILGVQIFKR